MIRHWWNSRPVVRSVDWRGIKISVEFDIGDTKRGVGDYGEIWVNTYTCCYGEIPDSRSPHDQDGVDVYLGPNLDAPLVWVVHQLKRDGTADEDKCMIAFDAKEDAIAAYVDHGPRWGLGEVDELTTDQFLNGYLASNRK